MCERVSRLGKISNDRDPQNRYVMKWSLPVSETLSIPSQSFWDHALHSVVTMACLVKFTCFLSFPLLSLYSFHRGISVPSGRRLEFFLCFIFHSGYPRCPHPFLDHILTFDWCLLDTMFFPPEQQHQYSEFNSLGLEIQIFHSTPIHTF